MSSNPAAAATDAIKAMFKPALAFRGDTSINEALSKIPISTFPKPADGVVVIPSTATVKEAVQTLAKANVLSAPVRDVTKPDDAVWEDKYLGMVRVRDWSLFREGYAVIWRAPSMSLLDWMLYLELMRNAPALGWKEARNARVWVL